MASALPYSTSLDIVGVFDSDFTQVFMQARPVYASVRPEARLMDHPLETGQIITDYKVILPLEIEYRVVLPSPYTRDLYEEIWNLWQNSELLTVQTKARNYTNMVIASPPHEEKTDYFDALPMTIRFRQAQLVQAVTTYAPADPTQANTQSLGDQNSYTVSGVAGAPNGQLTFSSIPPQQPAYTIDGVQTIGGTTSLPAQQSPFSASTIPVSGVQTGVNNVTIGQGFAQ